MVSLIVGDILIAAGAFYIGVYLRFGGIEEGLIKYQHIVMRGVSFESLIGPGVSARYNCIPPIPNIGKMATAKTMIPIPPKKWSCAR